MQGTYLARRVAAWHAGQLPHTCEKCGKGYTNTNNLKKHQSGCPPYPANRRPIRAN
ncbi:hypothetical protein T484DRAFT_1787902 [Baffinella frigidus]|nr:hypothetical protein T484DRAFT_1787902 [Cryptophyta sp. CCMP2293]